MAVNSDGKPRRVGKGAAREGWRRCLGGEGAKRVNEGGKNNEDTTGKEECSEKL